MQPALFRFNPQLRQSIAFTSLIESSTPVHAMKWAGGTGIKKYTLFTKREDLTGKPYGGNKVRNLEFLLGDVKARGYSRVFTVAPLGSNFTAALAAQANHVGVEVNIEHFVPVMTPQIRAHARFTLQEGARINLFPGRAGAVPAATLAYLRSLKHDTSFISPGGSHPLGVLGHVSAILELGEQVAQGLAPRPDTIVVGVGTCGTLAGLLVGIELLGWDTKVIGVRCVDRIVCHPMKVRSLANGAYRKLGMTRKLRRNTIHMVDVPRTRYGLPASDFAELRDAIWSSDRITVDTTYTGKVACYLSQALGEGTLPGRNILYWHTFSPAALVNAEKVLPRRPEKKYEWVHVDADRPSLGAV